MRSVKASRPPINVRTSRSPRAFLYASLLLTLAKDIVFMFVLLAQTELEARQMLQAESFSSIKQGHEVVDSE